MLRKSLLLAISSLLFWSGVALAAPTPMVNGQKVGHLALGEADKSLGKSLFGLPLSLSGKDTEYEGQTVYYYFYGTKDASNNYPLQVYSSVQRKIFIFEINSPDFATAEGIRVGSSEAALNKAYGTQLKKQRRGRIYTKYSLGDRKGTDFYVKDGKVTQILIRAY